MPELAMPTLYECTFEERLEGDTMFVICRFEGRVLKGLGVSAVAHWPALPHRLRDMVRLDAREKAHGRLLRSMQRALERARAAVEQRRQLDAQALASAIANGYDPTI